MQYMSLQQCADKVLRLSQRMLRHAEEKEWMSLSAIEQERGKALDHLFRHPEINDSLQTISDILFDVMEVDKTCMLLTEQARQSMLDELNLHRDAETSRQAVKLYIQNTA